MFAAGFLPIPLAVDTVASDYALPAIGARSGLSPVRLCPCRAYQKRGQNLADAGSILFAIQIYDIFRRNPNPVTFRNTLAIVKMRRFAADGAIRVLYYEERMDGSAVLAAIGMPED